MKNVHYEYRQKRNKTQKRGIQLYQKALRQSGQELLNKQQATRQDKLTIRDSNVRNQRQLLLEAQVNKERAMSRAHLMTKSG